MAQLHASDILKLFKYLTISRNKIWEFIRSYDPMDIATFLYLLENVSKEKYRKIIDIDDNFLYNQPILKSSKNQHVITIKTDLIIRLERSLLISDDAYWNESQPISQYKIQNDASISQIYTDIINKVPVERMKSLLQKIVTHNLGTNYYYSFIKNIEHLLFHDTLHNDRNEVSSVTNSIVHKFLHFYQSINRKTIINKDPRSFRFLILPPPIRIYDRNLPPTGGKYHYQPLYQGFHVVVYSTPHETKCYNRFGEICKNLVPKVRSDQSCTFEAIILPTDKYDHVRSWRYWHYRKNIIMYIVDVFMLNGQMLLQVPFCERIKYAHQIENTNQGILQIPTYKTANCWYDIEKQYIRNKDIYDPIIGIFIRKSESLVPTKHYEYRFNILYAFDLLSETKIIQLKDCEDIRRIHLNLEMAEKKTICLAYGHNEEYIFLCYYNREIHHYVHCANLQRSPYEPEPLRYKAEPIFVVNSQTENPQGLLYLRIYYNSLAQVIGYDRKNTDSRFNVMFNNDLLEPYVKMDNGLA